MLADGSLAWLCSKRFYTEVDSDRHTTKQWIELEESYGRVQGSIKALKEIEITQEEQQSIDLDP